MVRYVNEATAANFIFNEESQFGKENRIVLSGYIGYRFCRGVCHCGTRAGSADDE